LADERGEGQPFFLFGESAGRGRTWIASRRPVESCRLSDSCQNFGGILCVNGGAAADAAEVLAPWGYKHAVPNHSFFLEEMLHDSMAFILHFIMPTGLNVGGKDLPRAIQLSLNQN